MDIPFLQSDGADPLRLKFDVIFCRNVMIYFDQPTRDALVRRFYDAMEPRGLSVHQPLRIPEPESPVSDSCPQSTAKVTMAFLFRQAGKDVTMLSINRKVRVLVVDDSAVARTFLTRGLSSSS